MLKRASAAAVICLGGLILVALLSFGACGSGEGGAHGAEPLRLSLHVPPSVKTDETVALKLVVKNVSDGPVELGPGGSEDTGFAGSYDFAVSTPVGLRVWSFLRDGAAEAVPPSTTLNPGEQLTLTGEWSQRDANGFAVIAGSYVVRGFVSVRLDVDSRSERPVKLLETEAKPLAIQEGFRALKLSLEAPSSVRAGETVPLTLIAKNVTDAPVEFGLGGFPGAFCGDFVVTTPDGVELWRFIDGDPPESRVCPANLYVKTLSPGEELQVQGEWQQTDTRSVPVAAGSYLVRGVLDIRLGVDTPDERGLTLETETKPLAIVGEQPPQPIGLTLEVPPSVGAGEPVPLRLIATNVSDAPVTLGLWGPPTFCRDFVVSTADGLEVWRRLDAVPCIYFSRITFERKTLNPGEELILEDKWDQTGTRGNPVAAGSYVVRGSLPTTLGMDTPAERVLTLQTEAKPLVIGPQ